MFTIVLRFEGDQRFKLMRGSISFQVQEVENACKYYSYDLIADNPTIKSIWVWLNKEDKSVLMFTAGK